MSELKHRFSSPAASGGERRLFRPWLVILALGSILGAQAEPAAFPEFTVTDARTYLESAAKTLQAQAGTGAEVLLMQATLQNHLGQEDEAERLARQALEKEPARADILSFLAQLLIRREHLEEAARCLRQAVQLDPKTDSGFRRLGMVLDRLGNKKEARTAFEAGIREIPEDATCYLLLGRMLLDDNQPKEAAAQLEKACRLDPKSANGFYVLHQAQLRLGEKEAAQATLKIFKETRKNEEVVEKDAMSVSIDSDKYMRTLTCRFHTEAATLLSKQAQPDLAEAHLRQAMKVAPTEPLSYEMLAGAYLRTGRLPAARSLYEDMVRHWPSNAVYRANLGTLLLQMKESSAAVGELKRALELNLNQPAALANLARCYLGARREMMEALTLCLRLVDLEPTATNYDLLGWAYYANGQSKEARKFTAKAVAMDPTNPSYREHLRRLEAAP